MTDHERNRLTTAYTEYLNGSFNELTSFVVAVVGLCLGTLSASKIPDVLNLAIVSIVCLIFLVLVFLENGAPKSNLKKIITELENKYRDKNEPVMKEIRSYDIWKGRSGRVIKHNLPLTFSAVFCIYTLAEHSAKFFNWW